MHTPRLYKSAPTASHAFVAGNYKFSLPNNAELTIYCNEQTTIADIQKQIYSAIVVWSENEKGEQIPVGGYAAAGKWTSNNHNIPVPNSFCQISFVQLKIMPEFKPYEAIIEAISDEKSSLDEVYVINNTKFSAYNPSINETYAINIAIPNPHDSITFIQQAGKAGEIASKHERKISGQATAAISSGPETYIIQQLPEEKGEDKKSRCLVM